MSAALIVRALGWTLIHGLWQAALLALFVRLALLVTRSPRLRFVWAWSALAMIGLAFVATWRLELARGQALLAQVAAAPIAAEPSAPIIEHVDVGLPWLLVQIEAALPWLVLVWLCGAGGFALRAGLGLIGVARLRASAQAVDAQVEALCRRLADRLGVDAAVAVATSPSLDAPAVIGWLRPLILLPVGFAAKLDPTTLEAALAHELAHVRRGDHLLNAVVIAVEAACFHHPCVWWLAAVARREREHACDDLVVAQIQDRRRYAHALLQLEQLRPSLIRPAPALGALRADGAPLLDRVRRLLTQPNPTPMPTPTSTSTLTIRLPAWAPAFALLAALGLSLAAPACAESPDATVEGTIDPGDPQVSLGVPWLPDNVARHRAAIEEAARRHGVDPDLLAIVILVESGGDPQAQSPAGARGLMQIMPATAQEIADARAITDFDPTELSQPERNIDFGAWYLARQLERWGEVELAAAAYNGGPATVAAWQAGEGTLSAETEHYRSLVSALWQGRHAKTRPAP